MDTSIKYRVRLTQPETLLIYTLGRMPSVLATQLSDATSPRVDLLLTLDEIDDLVELLHDEFVATGFNANDTLNQRGRLLEELADRLFAEFLQPAPEQPQ